jgi:DUF1365 family protein
MESAIYRGTIYHRRLFPARHEFTYKIFMAFLDIERLPELMNISSLTGYNRRACVAYRECDHFGDPRETMRERIRRDAVKNNVPLPEGPIFLLTHLRYFGYNFNPVSFFYCFDRDEKLHSVLAEVNNTFGETQNYWLTSQVEVPAENHKRYRFLKSFHVSPFMKMGHEYDWTFMPPGDRLVTKCLSLEAGQEIFNSTLNLERRPWSSRELNRAILTFPWITAQVICAIHWQALRLLVKNVPVVKHPGAGQFDVVNAKNMGASWRVG